MNMKRIWGLFLALSLSYLACTKKEVKLFQKIPSSESGIAFVNQLESTPELNILTYLYYYNGAGVAAADFNNDSLIDLFFIANQGVNRLYLNNGDFRFRDVTETANLVDGGNWTTGVTYVDINTDGLLDLYVCKAGGYRALQGRNLLYVNQGNNSQGDPVFKEQAKEYGLDFSGLSTQAAFFDYDQDGDLDLYLMNHSVHPNRAYGRGNQRSSFDAKSGDRLYKNEDGKFVDVSFEAGIYQGKIGYGLGLGISDLNKDGFPDIYVGNDFFENDYLYLNQKDGTFREVISAHPEKLGHTSHFSMGNDLADINNDGLIDIVSLDMLPANLETYKASGLEYAYPTYQFYLKNGYSPQYMQNTLHLNLGDATFSEIGHLSGIAATEWSWSALMADYDNDGLKDLFISNGIKGATNDMDFVNFISNEEIQRNIDKGMTEADLDLTQKIPENKVPNYFYKNIGNMRFEDVTEKWSHAEPSFSNGSIYADLDNDGDLDIVVNNVNEEAYILKNQSDTLNNYLKVSFRGPEKNPFGIGAKVSLYSNDKILKAENYNSRGYLSAVPPVLHFGLGKDILIDSLSVVWPQGYQQTLKGISANQEIKLDFQDAELPTMEVIKSEEEGYEVNLPPHIAFIHKDLTSIEFNRNPLAPYASTNEGPDIAVGDINNDQLDDFIISGAKKQPSALFIQSPSGEFTMAQQDLFQEDAQSEDVSQVFFDANGDQWQDLLVVSGGNEYKTGNPLQPRLYININGNLQRDTTQFKDLALNASKVDAVDIDGDGDLDVTIGSDLVPWEFGMTPKQYIFENNGQGDFKDITTKFAPQFAEIGNVRDFQWADIDHNGFKDLIVAGHWMPLQILLNDGSSLQLQTDNGLNFSNGWWNTIEVVDIDKDGDLDLVAGNFGENSLLQASKKEPVTLYRQDFDDNGSVETLVTYYSGGKETALASKDELVKQLPYLNKDFLSYNEYAKATLKQVFGQDQLKNALKKYTYTLSSKYFLNDGEGNFTSYSFPELAQASVVKDIEILDINKDGFPDLLLAGNIYEISTQLGRMDGSHGVILQNDQKGGYIWVKNTLGMISGPVRDLEKIRIKNREFWIVGVNSGRPVILNQNR